MMSKPIRWVLWVFALAAGAVMLALAGRYGTGYAVFVVPPWRIELSIMMFCLIALVAAGGMYALIRLLVRVGALPRQMREKKIAAEQQRVTADLHQSLKALFGGRFDDAEKLARRAMQAKNMAGSGHHHHNGHDDIRPLAAALAAWAAHEGGNLPAALPYLETITDARNANMRDVSKAYMLLAEGRAAEALPLLQAQAAADAGNIGVLKMKVEAEIAAAAWPDVLLTLASLKRTGLMPQHAVDAIRLNAEIELIKTRGGGREVLVDEWRRLDSRSRYHPRLVETLARRMIAAGLDNDAAAIIEETIDKSDHGQWDSTLAALVLTYAGAKSENTTAQIELAEAWLKQHPREPAVLAALGRLCMRIGLWGKAQSYLEASVALEPTLDAHMTLARLMEQVGKPHESMRHIKRGADLASADH